MAKQTVRQIEYAKVLRKQIMAIVKGTKGWSDSYWRDLLEEWGYGRSLRKLTVDQLLSVKAILVEPAKKRPDPFKYTGQAAYCDHLRQEAGLNEDRARKLYMIKFSKAHLNSFNKDELTRLIPIYKGIISQNEKQRRKNG